MKTLSLLILASVACAATTPPQIPGENGVEEAQPEEISVQVVTSDSQKTSDDDEFGEEAGWWEEAIEDARELGGLDQAIPNVLDPEGSDPEEEVEQGQAIPDAQDPDDVGEEEVGSDSDAEDVIDWDQVMADVAAHQTSPGLRIM
jgi:hypothetical protein